jgi:hypothetical protein
MIDDAPIESIAGPPAAHSEPARSESAPVQPARRNSAAVIAAAAWIIPGLGHLLLRRRGKAAAFFVAVAGLALLGYAMRGDVFVPGSDGPFGMLGFLADIGGGIFYVLSRVIEYAGSDLSRSAGDYGTRLIAAAGIVNMLAVIDAYETAGRRRT